MTDNGNQQPANTASITAYRADGWRVHFSFTIASVEDATARIAELAANGYTPNAPGMKPGETFEEIGYVSRRQKADGTPVLDLYSPNEAVKRKVFTLYIDSDQDATDFKAATGLDFKTIPLYEGEAAISKESPSAGKYVIPVKQAAKVILEPNPAHDPNETDLKKMKPKHKFVRWDGIAATASTPANVVGSITPQTNASEAFDAAFPPNATVTSKHWTADTEAQKKFFQWANKTHGINDYAVLEALDVKAITLFTGSKQDALNAVKAFVDAKQREAS